MAGLSQNVKEYGVDFVERFLKTDAEHAGVKGMRWGVRRSQAQLDRAAGRKPNKDDKDERGSKTKSKEESRTKTGGKTKDLSDAELRQKLNRLQMEKQYNDLTNPTNKGLAAAGKKVAANALKGVATTTLQNLGQSYATKYTADFMAGGAKAFDRGRRAATG